MAMNSSCDSFQGAEALGANRCANPLPTLGRTPRRYRHPSDSRKKEKPLFSTLWFGKQLATPPPKQLTSPSVTVVLWCEVAKPAHQSGDTTQPQSTSYVFLKMELESTGEEGKEGGCGLRSVQPHLGKSLQSQLSGILQPAPTSSHISSRCSLSKTFFFCPFS